MNIFTAMEGAGLRRWYVAKNSPCRVLDGPYRTRREAREAVFRMASKAGDPEPWPQLETFNGWPGFAALRTGQTIYYVGRASAFHDQGTEWANAIDNFLSAGPRNEEANA